MSTSPFPAPYARTSNAATQHLPSIEEAPALPIRRRANIDQARAIEKLGHAIDHLTYSHLFVNGIASEKANNEAIHILMCLKRSVFEECERMTTADRTVRQWLTVWPLKRSN